MNSHFFDHASLSVLPVPSALFDVRFISTENITVAFNIMLPGAEVPPHDHVHETIDIVQEGELEMTIGDRTVLMHAGMVAKVPSNVPHSAKAVTPCKVINIFYPVREDFTI